MQGREKDIRITFFFFETKGTFIVQDVLHAAYSRKQWKLWTWEKAYQSRSMNSFWEMDLADISKISTLLLFECIYSITFATRISPVSAET